MTKKNGNGQVFVRITNREIYTEIKTSSENHAKDLKILSDKIDELKITTNEQFIGLKSKASFSLKLISLTGACLMGLLGWFIAHLQNM